MSREQSEVDALFESLESGVRAQRVVQGMDNTSKPGPYLTSNTTGQDEFGVYTNRIDALFNDRPAYQAILKESPRHRLILWMTAQGHSPQQVADALGITKQTVYIVRKQPWFREMFVRLTTDLGRDAVSTFLKSEVLPSLQTLVEVRDNPQAKDSDRRGAADSLLDRFLGKPVAKADTDAKAPADVPDEIDRLKAEATQLAEELKTVGINFQASNS